MEVRSKVRGLDLKNNPVETWILEENTENAINGYNCLANGIRRLCIDNAQGGSMPDAKTSFDINFEKQILDTACVLRGNIDTSEYGNVVLGLSFLKYISEGIFFALPAARWSVIARAAHTPEIGTVTDAALRSIGRVNHRLNGDILPKISPVLSWTSAVWETIMTLNV